MWSLPLFWLIQVALFSAFSDVLKDLHFGVPFCPKVAHRGTYHDWSATTGHFFPLLGAVLSQGVGPFRLGQLRLCWDLTDLGHHMSSSHFVANRHFWWHESLIFDHPLIQWILWHVSTRTSVAAMEQMGEASVAPALWGQLAFGFGCHCGRAQCETLGLVPRALFSSCKQQILLVNPW